MADTAVHSASLRIEAPADALYDIVTDVAGMGRLSPECTGGRWLDGVSGPAPGVRFKGTNKRGMVRWSTVNRVIEAERGVVFSFDTLGSGARWTYRFAPDGDGTVVTETRQMVTKRPLLAAVFAGLLLGGTESHDEELNAGLAATLDRLRTAARGS